ncbi:hypothetical protein NM208_g15468 [Fusarium decemcellulare]|uniref:Uncharacterized protein n=1 Tax=Fusarium decemcellulare TaxID=57161 RepID=A0ACC1RFJ0_9HYPO|nr:hypothetical protein NM208_g15468 [Fusarium decemcellulare]
MMAKGNKRGNEVESPTSTGSKGFQSLAFACLLIGLELPLKTLLFDILTASNLLGSTFFDVEFIQTRLHIGRPVGRIIITWPTVIIFLVIVVDEVVQLLVVFVVKS